MSKLLDLWADMTGVVLDYALSTPPSPAWLMCYGQALEDGDPTVARLRDKLIADGFPYGDDGNGNPLVPDARGRTTAGKDDMGGSAANRLTSGGSGIDGTMLGAAGGSQTHTLTTSEMPSHSHSATAESDGSHSHTGSTASSGAHTHTIANTSTVTNNSNPSTSGWNSVNSGSNITTSSNGSHTHTVTINSGGAHTHNVTVDSEGGGVAHRNVQPTLVLNKIIKL